MLQHSSHVRLNAKKPAFDGLDAAFEGLPRGRRVSACGSRACAGHHISWPKWSRSCSSSAAVTGDLPGRNRASPRRPFSENATSIGPGNRHLGRESVAFLSTTSVVGAPPEYRRRVRGVESSSQPFAPPIVSGVRRTCWHTQCSLSFVFDCRPPV